VPKYYLTTPLYYVNATPHIGHTYTTMAAETIARFKRMEGFDAVMFTGTDEHGQKVERAAEATGKSPQEFTTPSRRVPQPVEKLNIRVDRTSAPRPRHHRVVQWLFQRCLDRGFIYKGSYTGSIAFTTSCTSTRQAGRRMPGVWSHHRDGYGRELLLQTFGVHGAAAGAIRSAAGIHPAETRRNEVLAFVRSG